MNVETQIPKGWESVGGLDRGQGLTRAGFQRAFHAARRLYWRARARLNLDRAKEAEEAACRLASVAQDAGMLTEAQEVQLSRMSVDLDGWIYVMETGRTLEGF